MASIKKHQVWAYVPRSIREATDNYITEHNISLSDFVRSAIIEKLYNEKFLTEENLKDLLVS